MSVFIASLNSGSNGNCYYIGNSGEAVLIDAGISCRETEKRMRRLGLSMDLIKAIFISHEHIDHVKGVEVLSKRYGLPVYITPATLNNSITKPPLQHVRAFVAHMPVPIGGLMVTAFPKWHDAADAHSFVVESSGVRIGVLTDIGAPCDHVAHYFGQCHAAFLETNYDDEMLANGRYPYHLKKRISGDKGHMSNAQALDLFRTHRPGHMSHLFLSHLSRDNNDPGVALEAFRPHAGDVHVTVASRYNETEVYEIGAAVARQHTSSRPVQASLFS
ncbi:MBL fold metallo-hydrolase [Nemorincola caseinilytica]|uniref:MBL fold metallo-hydrolase n=1 Tax=Nemorincola caseinilytica TaxID=2054315 RepID=A0ABP8NKG8_9BACT